MSARRAQSPPSHRVSGLAAAGIGIAWALAIDPDQLRQGGLGVAAVMACSALLLGAPLARAEVGSARDGAWDVAARTFLTLWGIALVGALAAPVVVALGVRGGVGLALVWLAMPLIRAHSVHAAFALVGVLAAAGALFASGGGGFTLLAPQWSNGAAWAPAAVGAGLVLAGVGSGRWSRDEPVARDGDRAPWLAAGLGLLALTLSTAALGGLYERGATLAIPAIVLALPAAIGAAAAGGGVRSRLAHAGAGLVATLWFAGPAWEIRAIFLGSLVLVGPFVAAVRVALLHQGPKRVLGATVAVACVLFGGLAFPGLPPSAWSGLAAAALVVVPFWLAATRGVLLARELG